MAFFAVNQLTDAVRWPPFPVIEWSPLGPDRTRIAARFSHRRADGYPRRVQIVQYGYRRYVAMEKQCYMEISSQRPPSHLWLWDDAPRS